MKLPIKHEFFILIQQGLKDIEFRDAHITFIDEDTKEEMRKEIIDVQLGKACDVPKEVRHVFSDRHVIAFLLKK